MHVQNKEVAWSIHETGMGFYPYNINVLEEKQ